MCKGAVITAAAETCGISRRDGAGSSFYGNFNFLNRDTVPSVPSCVK